MTDIRSWLSRSQAVKRAAGERSLAATDVLRNRFISLLDDQYGTNSHELRQSSVLTTTQEWRQGMVLPPKGAFPAPSAQHGRREPS